MGHEPGSSSVTGTSALPIKLHIEIKKGCIICKKSNNLIIIQHCINSSTNEIETRKINCSNLTLLNGAFPIRGTITRKANKILISKQRNYQMEGILIGLQKYQ